MTGYRPAQYRLRHSPLKRGEESERSIEARNRAGSKVSCHRTVAERRRAQGLAISSRTSVNSDRRRRSRGCHASCPRGSARVGHADLLRFGCSEEADRRDSRSLRWKGVNIKREAGRGFPDITGGHGLLTIPIT